MTEQTTVPFGHVHISDDLMLSRIGESQFAVLVFERGLAHFAQLHWPTRAGSLEPLLPYAIATSRTERARSCVLDLERVIGVPCVGTATLSGETLYVRFAAAEQPALREAEGWLRGCIEPVSARTTAERRLPIEFWTSAGYSVARRIAVPAWEEIAANYPAAVRSGLERLFAGRFRPDDGGQLVLWHGDPGTGKTYALRALAWAWREWCDTHYVTDPEVFFGAKAEYMMDVLLEEGDEDEPERWRVLVLEDTADLLAVGGSGGPGLARLLNVVDGIVGQGLRILVLVTTNEPLTRLHPAVSRPGRCAARVEFGAFGPEEAEAWLAERGGAGPAPSRPTLARLYAHLRGEPLSSPEASRPSIGFVR